MPTTAVGNRQRVRARPAEAVPDERPAPSATRFWTEVFLSFATYFGAAAASTAVLVVVLQLWRAYLSIPIANRGDALWTQSWVKGIADNGWYLVNPRLGAPGQMELYDFPQTDSVHFLLLKLLVLATHDFAAAFNLYYLLGFPLITISTLFVLRRFGVSRPAAAASSLLFSFVPYHLARGEYHLFLSSYFFVPPAIMVVLWVYLDRLRWPWSKKDPNLRWGRGRMWASLLTMGLVASAGVYYAFFTCYLLFVAGLASLLDRQKLRGPLMACTLVAVVGAGMLANLWPSLVYRREHGNNAEAATRYPHEAEVYGLKIGQMVLWINRHVVGRLNPRRQSYDLLPLAPGDEKESAALGAVGTAGFLFLLGLLLCRTRARQGDVMPGLVVLNIGAVLLATIGGFGSLFALLISPQIRCYNRMSIFIAMVALFAVAVLLDRARAWWLARGHRAWQFQVALVLLTAGGLVDEIGRNRAPDYAALKAQFEGEGEFVRQIEEQLPAESRVYQLPYFAFPETPPLHQISGYDPVRLYLHSGTLRFSFGAMKGREIDRWQRELNELPLEEQLSQLVDHDFRGIAVDRAGYADQGAEIEARLSESLGQAPLVSSDQRLSFFTLPAKTEQADLARAD
jgi:phosphoglycerol transferase